MRKNVCRALVMLLEVRASDLHPHMHPIIEVGLLVDADMALRDWALFLVSVHVDENTRQE